MQLLPETSVPSIEQEVGNRYNRLRFCQIESNGLKDQFPM